MPTISQRLWPVRVPLRTNLPNRCQTWIPFWWQWEEGASLGELRPGLKEMCVSLEWNRHQQPVWLLHYTHVELAHFNHEAQEPVILQPRGHGDLAVICLNDMFVAGFRPQTRTVQRHQLHS